MESVPLLYDLSREELAAWLVEHGQPAYRARQVFGWLYRRFALAYEQMTDLPRALRESLAGAFRLPGCRVVAQAEGVDTRKLLVEYDDGALVECVALRMDALPTFCLSSQVGCALGCAFCASSLDGCERNLTAGEILAQAAVLGAAQGRPGNVVFMGMGEPLLNLEHVAVAVRRLTDPEGCGLSPRRVTVATAGIVPQIRRLAELDLGVNLAVSLNASRDEQRRELMPGVARWSLAELLEACHQFTQATGGQPVTFAYVLLRGVNDFPADADRLVKLLRPLRHHLNLIPCNPVQHALLQPPSEGHARRFLERLQAEGLNASLRQSKGGEIQAACGQLRRRAGAEEESTKPRPGGPGHEK